MTDHSNDSFPNLENGATVVKFEQMLANKASYYFDIEEIEGLVDHYLDRFDEVSALNAVEHGLGLFPKNASLEFKLAQVLVMRNEAGHAMHILERLEAMEPANTDLMLFKAVVYRNLGDHTSAMNCLESALQSTTGSKVDIYLDMAYEQEMAQNYSGAINSLKESIQLHPDHEPTLFELSYCYEMKGDVEGAIAFFTAYLDERPYSYLAWYNLALAHDKLGAFDEALEAVEYSLAITEDFTGGHIFRAQMFLMLENSEKALEAYHDGLAADPENPVLYAALGECHEDLKNIREAEVNYLQALHFDPDCIEAIMGMGAVREAQGKMKQAAHLYREAVDKDIFNIENQHIYAETLIKLGESEAAEQRYKNLLDIDSDDEDAWIGLAETWEARNDFKRACAVVEDGMSKLNGTTDLKWHFIELLLRTGRSSQAEMVFHEAAVADPEGIKYFVTIFRDALYFPNIAALIDFYTQVQSKNEL